MLTWMGGVELCCCSDRQQWWLGSIQKSLYFLSSPVLTYNYYQKLGAQTNNLVLDADEVV